MINNAANGDIPGSFNAKDREMRRPRNASKWR
jgi:hypothetical protein